MKKSEKFLAVILALAIMLTLVSCTTSSNDNGQNTPETTQAQTPTSSPDEQGDVYVDASDKFTDFDRRISFGKETDVQINLSEQTEATVTIDRGGVYVLSGTYSGQIIVDVEKTEKVQLVLNGVQITGPANAAAIYVKSADKVAITLPGGTTNTINDTADGSGETETNACIYSKDDLSINGLGSLTVTANYNNGIYSKNDLKFVSGNITVTAKNNAIKGKGSVLVNSGVINVTSEDDGIKATEDMKPEKGFVCIEGGDITITSTDDAISAVTSIVISGGKVTTHAGGKAVKCDGKINVAPGTLIEK